MQSPPPCWSRFLETGPRSRSSIVLLLLLTGPIPSPTTAQQPPEGLIPKIAANGTRFRREFNHYTYRQRFIFYELGKNGAALGSYREVRDILFTPGGERTEEFVGRPITNLKRMRLTAEDFRDVREVQPFVLTEDNLGAYEVTYRGAEKIDGEDCYVFQLKPRQILAGQRLFDGLIWVSRQHQQAVRVAGKPVPQIHRVKRENLFPHFTTVYQAVEGKFWFPVKTIADDTVPFSSGLQRVRYIIDYENYKRFTASSTIVFDKDAR